MPKVEVLDRKNNAPQSYWFDCPGCGCSHSFWVIEPHPGGPVWKFNGSLDKPTVSPSILVTYPMQNKTRICHSFVREGKIQFLNDCTHELKGKTVELPELK